MLSIAIDRVNARYHLPPAAAREQPRVRRVVDDALARVLESAIECRGIGREGYVCIREVHAVIKMRLREPDSALASGVGDAIAVAVRRLIDERSPLVVEYGSRVQALVDLTSSALAGDFTRSWAWAQVGIWRTDFPLSADLTADLIVRALANEPTHAVSVAAHLAREQKDRFHVLVARATAKSWAALAKAAITAAGGSAVPTRAPDAPGVVRALTDAAREMQALATIARRVVSHSAIAGATVERFASDSAVTRGALSALVLLEAEPSAARREDLPRLLNAIEQVIAGAASSHPARRGDLRDLQVAGDDGPAASAAPLAPRHEDTQAARVEDTSTSRIGALLPDSDGATPRVSGESVTRHDDEAALQAERHRIDADKSASPAESLAEALPNVRAVRRTRHGGLLYLVNLVTRTGFVETIMADPWWSGRGLRWLLHQLAMSLAATEPDDPAALVFAGLAPGTSPPSSLQDPPTEPERAAIDTLRDVLVQALRDAFGESPDLDTASDDAVVGAVCARPAQIVAEPGWIEAHFSLEDVSLDIRRVGLDRNPDWVPWLGIVLRFVYA